MKEGFKDEANEYTALLNIHKQELSKIQELGDASLVKGFDFEMGAEDDDSIDKLDIYAKFLGENEYLKMKDNYNRALNAMMELHNVEHDRINMNAPV